MLYKAQGPVGCVTRRETARRTRPFSLWAPGISLSAVDPPLIKRVPRCFSYLECATTCRRATAAVLIIHWGNLRLLMCGRCCRAGVCPSHGAEDAEEDTVNTERLVITQKLNPPERYNRFYFLFLECDTGGVFTFLFLGSFDTRPCAPHARRGTRLRRGPPTASVSSSSISRSATHNSSVPTTEVTEDAPSSRSAAGS